MRRGGATKRALFSARLALGLTGPLGFAPVTASSPPAPRQLSVPQLGRCIRDVGRGESVMASLEA